MRVLLITDPRFSIEKTLQAIEAAANALRGIPGERLVVQLRDKERERTELEEIARKIHEVTARTKSILVVNAVAGHGFEVAARVGADGVHVACTLQSIEKARAAGFEWISVPAHSDDDVRIAEEAGATAALVSPIFESPGKGPARGVSAIERAVAIAKRTRIYALGGIDGRSRAAACREAGAYGVAVIRALLDAPDPANVARQLADFHDG